MLLKFFELENAFMVYPFLIFFSFLVITILAFFIKTKALGVEEDPKVFFTNMSYFYCFCLLMLTFNLFIFFYSSFHVFSLYAFLQLLFISKIINFYYEHWKIMLPTAHFPCIILFFNLFFTIDPLYIFPSIKLMVPACLTLYMICRAIYNGYFFPFAYMQYYVFPTIIYFIIFLYFLLVTLKLKIYFLSFVVFLLGFIFCCYSYYNILFQIQIVFTSYHYIAIALGFALAIIVEIPTCVAYAQSGPDCDIVLTLSSSNTTVEFYNKGDVLPENMRIIGYANKASLSTDRPIIRSTFELSRKGIDETTDSYELIAEITSKRLQGNLHYSEKVFEDLSAETLTVFKDTYNISTTDPVEISNELAFKVHKSLQYDKPYFPRKTQVPIIKLPRVFNQLHTNEFINYFSYGVMDNSFNEKLLVEMKNFQNYLLNNVKSSCSCYVLNTSTDDLYIITITNDRKFFVEFSQKLPINSNGTRIKEILASRNGVLWLGSGDIMDVGRVSLELKTWIGEDTSTIEDYAISAKYSGVTISIYTAHPELALAEYEALKTQYDGKVNTLIINDSTIKYRTFSDWLRIDTKIFRTRVATDYQAKADLIKYRSELKENVFPPRYREFKPLQPPFCNASAVNKPNSVFLLNWLRTVFR